MLDKEKISFKAVKVIGKPVKIIVQNSYGREVELHEEDYPYILKEMKRIYDK